MFFLKFSIFANLFHQPEDRGNISRKLIYRKFKVIYVILMANLMGEDENLEAFSLFSIFSEAASKLKALASGFSELSKKRPIRKMLT